MTREEAIKIVQSATVWTDEEREALGVLIPEFSESESEDEKIRKALIWHLKADMDFVSNGVTKAECLAYLEKQRYDRMQPVYDNQESFESALDKAWKSYNDSGERTVDGCEDNYTECAYAKGFREGYLFGLEKQKETDIRWFKSDNVKNPDKPYIDKAGMFYTTDGRMCYASEIEKQKEPHYTKRNALFDKCVENCDPEVMKSVSDEIDEMLEKEQKSAWSEDDDRMLESLLWHLRYSINGGDVDHTAGQIEKWINDRFKSLRPQPKQEWGEEDEEIWNHIIDCAESRAWIPFNEISWLVAHKPQSHWKPSEEQMESLAYAIQVLNSNPHPKSAKAYQDLQTLYKNIKYGN